MPQQRMEATVLATEDEEEIQIPSLEAEQLSSQSVPVPHYLEETYWWAYVRPWAVKFFEREWLVDLILWGNYRRLLQAALDVWGEDLPGRTAQIACVYGDLSRRLNQRVESSKGSLDIIDVLKVQLDNTREKMGSASKVRLINMDSSDLKMPEGTYDRALLFFLLHEQPRAVRNKTLREAMRVVKPGGTLLILDFCKPSWWNPLKYIWLPILGILEPFAPDLWKHHDITSWMPKEWNSRIVQRKTFFGGLYQTILLRKP